MRKIREIPVGGYRESGARIQKSHYTFYEARLGNEDEGDYEVIAWARWETFFNTGWTHMPPADFGLGLPESEDGRLAWEVSAENTPQEYEMRLTVFEDFSGQLQINKTVSLDFPKGSFIRLTNLTQ